MNCSRCHHPLAAAEKGICKQCRFDLNAGGQRSPEDTTADYRRSPIKRGVQQGLLIVVFMFLLAALIQMFTNDFQLPKYTGDVVAILGLSAGIVRIIFAIVLKK